MDATALHQAGPAGRTVVATNGEVGGPEPGQLARTGEDLVEIGATSPGRDRADAALVRAVAGSGAELVVLPHPDAGVDPRLAGSASGHPAPPDQLELRDGLGAVLRFSTS